MVSAKIILVMPPTHYMLFTQYQMVDMPLTHYTLQVTLDLFLLGIYHIIMTTQNSMSYFFLWISHISSMDYMNHQINVNTISLMLNLIYIIISYLLLSTPLDIICHDDITSTSLAHELHVEISLLLISDSKLHSPPKLIKYITIYSLSFIII